MGGARGGSVGMKNVDSVATSVGDRLVEVVFAEYALIT
jgi:hypothetical protein